MSSTKNPGRFAGSLYLLMSIIKNAKGCATQFKSLPHPPSKFITRLHLYL